MSSDRPDPTPVSSPVRNAAGPTTPRDRLLSRDRLRSFDRTLSNAVVAIRMAPTRARARSRDCVTPLARAAALAVTIVLAACSGPDDSADIAGAYDVEEVPLHQISDDLAAGRTSSAEVTRGYIARIEAMDGPLNSVIAIAPDALEQAAASDARRAEGASLGPLDGVPILLKDNLDAVGMPTTAGSFALEHNLPARDSEVVRRLRAAGVVILGKANLSQFAGFRNSASLNGSTLGGGTHNPYDVSRSAAGSSNGSGIAAAMSFAAATIGTETGGSIIGPSSVNGVVGMKPTIALVSRRGIVPISLNQDSSGPMARSVRDVAMVLDAIAGSDPEDPWTEEADANRADYVAALDGDGLSGRRLGVLRPTDADGEAAALFDAALEVLAARGAELVELPADALVDPRPEMRVILVHDFKVDLDAYLSTTPSEVPVKSLAELIEFSRTDARESMHTMDLWEAAQATTGGRQSPAFVAAREAGLRLTREEGIDRLLAEHGLDALVAPSGSPAGVIPPDGREGPGPIPEGPRGTRPASLTTTAAVAGYPLISVPMGLADGLPVGLTFAGPPWSESLLLGLAYDYEQASHARVPPPRAVAGGGSAAPSRTESLPPTRSAAATAGEALPTELEMTTWSVVGVDPETGDVGVAVASCVPTHGDAVAALVPGMGAAATQAGFDVANRNRVFEAIQEGLSAEQVVQRVTDPDWDDELDRRQYGVVTMHDGLVHVAGYTTRLRQGITTGDDGSTRYAGVMADASRGVSSQGNTLESEEVVSRPLDAYRWDDPSGFNWLSDRLMRALEAGSVAGGDVRCNDERIRQTASMAVILVARGGDAPYATDSIGRTDAGTADAPWLALSVATERMAENPLLELRRQYDEWRRTATLR